MDLPKTSQSFHQNQNVKQHVRKRGGWTVGRTTVRRVGKKKRRATSDPDTVGNAFADAFGHVDVSQDEPPVNS